MRVNGASARGLVVLVFTAASLFLGYFGLRAYAASPAGQVLMLGRSFLDIMFADVQLFVLQAPLNGPGPFTLSLQIARFLAPATTILAAAEALRVLLSAQVRSWKAASASGHPIVTGDGPAALELSRRLRAKRSRRTRIRRSPRPRAKRKVVLVCATEAAAAQARRYRLLDVPGDPTDAATLNAAGLRRAAEVYACTEHSITNAATALRALEISQRRRRPLATYAQVRDAEICAALRARRIGTEGDPRFRLDFFSIEEVAAKVLLDQHRLPDANGTAPRVVIVGCGWLGRAVLREIARRRMPGGPLVTVLVQDDKPQEARSFINRFPAIRKNCVVEVKDRTAPFALADDAPTLMLVCLSDNDEALSAGLAAAHSVADRSDRVVICMGEPTPFDSVLTGKKALLDDVEGRLTVFDVMEEACVPDLIRADLNDRLARAIHHGYLEACAARGDSPQDNKSMRPWEELPEYLQQSNFAQAAHIGAMLSRIHCVITPESDLPHDFAFTDEEAELLAEMEHERWVLERQAAGFGYGPQRDERHHPDLVDWEQLSERARDKDRDAIRQFPAILEVAGFQVLRLRPATP
jgi:Trk K+ transport system NAD-binding subunit